MKTNNSNNEEISALADGELSTARQTALLQELALAESRHAWDMYHLIGDVVRSDDMATNCSVGCMEKLSARLALEPTYSLLVPISGTLMEADVVAPKIAHAPQRPRFARQYRFVAGIAAGVAVVYLGASYLVGNGMNGTGRDFITQLVAKNRSYQHPASESLAGVRSNSASQVVVLRDPRIDAYLMAHQQFAPSLYSTAQFARSAPLAIDSDK